MAHTAAVADLCNAARCSRRRLGSGVFVRSDTIVGSEEVAPDGAGVSVSPACYGFWKALTGAQHVRHTALENLQRGLPLGVPLCARPRSHRDRDAGSTPCGGSGDLCGPHPLRIRYAGGGMPRAAAIVLQREVHGADPDSRSWMRRPLSWPLMSSLPTSGVGWQVSGARSLGDARSVLHALAGFRTVPAVGVHDNAKRFVCWFAMKPGATAIVRCADGGGWDAAAVDPQPANRSDTAARVEARAFIPMRHGPWPKSSDTLSQPIE